MVIIRRKQHRALIEKGRHDGVDDGIRLPRARRSLNISYRILHGVVDRQQLIHIDVPVDQRNRIGSRPSGPLQQISEKGPDRHRHFLFPIQLHNGLIFFMQIQRNIRFQPDNIRHVVHIAAAPGHPPHDTVLDPFLIRLEIRKQLVLITVQKPTDALFCHELHRTPSPLLFDSKLRTDRDLFLRL